MSANPYCTFTVQAQCCCPKIIAIAHVLHYHRHEVRNVLGQHMQELADQMVDLNAAYAAALAEYQNATSAPSELSPAG